MSWAEILLANTIPAEVRTDQEFESNKRNTAKDGAAQKLLERWKASKIHAESFSSVFFPLEN